jgi:rubrerythrin
MPVKGGERLQRRRLRGPIGRTAGEAMRREDARARLVRQLQLAYSGELAAAHAYNGHWRSLSDPDERERIRRIEDEEWHHRRLVGEMLQALGAAPDARRERRLGLVGRTLRLLCHVSGWFLPMYAAGRLESRNVKEYEDAADHAAACGRAELVDCLLTMAEVEWEHERYFRAKTLGHWLARIVPVWAPIPPKETIRAARRLASGPAAAPDSNAPAPAALPERG